MLLRRDNKRVSQYLQAASEESISSMASDWQLNNAFTKLCRKESIVEENEPAEEENDHGHLEESSPSSAGETDDEGLNITQVHKHV